MGRARPPALVLTPACGSEPAPLPGRWQIMEHERARPAMRVLGAVLTCLLAATLVVAAQRPQGHPHTIRASVAAVSMADTGHANARADHDAAPSRSPSLAVAIAYAAAPAGIGAAPTERLAGSGPVRGPPGEARG